ncbi:MAG: hypothetical protein ACTSUE_01185 [Promethearchaeota archaeon]
MQLKISIKNQLRRIRNYIIKIYQKDYLLLRELDIVETRAQIEFISLKNVHKVYNPLYGIDLAKE